MTEKIYKHSITTALKPSIPGRRQYILVCSSNDDEEALTPVGWILRFNYRDSYGYTAMFTRLVTDFSHNTVTISLIYLPECTTVTEIFIK